MIGADASLSIKSESEPGKGRVAKNFNHQVVVDIVVVIIIGLPVSNLSSFPLEKLCPSSVLVISLGVSFLLGVVETPKPGQSEHFIPLATVFGSGMNK